MKNYYMIVICLMFFLLVCPMVVNAQTETTDATITESVDILDETVIEEIETIDNEEIKKTLTDIKDTLIVIEFTGLFAIVIHYVEKWLKLMTGITNSNLEG